MKYRNKTSYLPLFGSLLADVLIDYLSEVVCTHDFTDPLLLIVPSSRASIRTRGRHITHELAIHACTHGLSQWVNYQPHLLSTRGKFTKQTRLKNRSERLQNPRGAYWVRKPEHIFNRNIILIDDVYTTGATLEETTRILFQSGARRVIRITLAH